MTNHSDGLADFIEMTATRYEQDRVFRRRLLAETDETPQETAKRIRRDSIVVARRRTAS